MNISNLGAICYKHFDCREVVKSLRKVGGLPNLEPGGLNADQVSKAKKRAHGRLETYYTHLATLLGGITHPKQREALDTIKVLSKDDVNRIDAAYSILGKDLENVSQPGIALFLHVGDRSFALLPGIESKQNQSRVGPVYMSPRWSQTIFGLNNESYGNQNDLRLRIMRSNRLWQRERWSVLPGDDTAEPSNEKGAAYFNNIMLHTKPVDGWIDAFWGVQSGLRLPVPVGDGADSLLIILLTNYVPDAFAEWDAQPNKYVKAMPRELSERAIETLQNDFAAELQGLSYATTLLTDVIYSETTLLDAGMRVLAHYVDGERKDPVEQKPAWERRIVPLVQQLRQISTGLYGEVSDLEQPMESAFERLQKIAVQLPNGERAKVWRANLNRERQRGNQAAFSLLSPGCTVEDLVQALEALQESRLSIVTVSSEVEQYRSQSIDESLIHPYLLTAILENLLNKHNVSLNISIRRDPESDRKTLQLTAFYSKWTLSTSDESDFLLKPLSSNPPSRARNGFYLTAQVLWRNTGLIEYYPLCENSQPHRVALINLSIPL